MARNGITLHWASDALRADKDVVLAAVRDDADALAWASEALQADKDVVLAAVNNDGWALYDASKALRADKEVVLAAVTNNGRALESASYQLRADKEVVLAAVSDWGVALWRASEALRADKEVVLAAVNNDGEALWYASGALKADKEVVLAALMNDWRMNSWGEDAHLIEHMSEALRVDPLVVRLNAMESCAKRRWHVLKRWWLMRNLMAWLIGEWAKAEYAARFDAAGEAVMVGAGARAAKRDFATMMA